MYKVLQEKKSMVVDGLLSILSYKNQDNLEDSLNATAILTELIEMEKTFELFMANSAERVGGIMELAVDCFNQFNQRYLLQLLQVISNQLKQTGEQ